MLLGIMLCITIYFIAKISITINNLNDFSKLFEIYSIITYQYGKVIYYFNNLQLLFINQKLGIENVFDNMLEEVEEQTAKENKIKAKYLINYKKVYNLFQAFNRKLNDTAVTDFREVLCENNQYCRKVLNSNYNIVTDGIDVAIKTIIVATNNYFNDFKKLKSKIKNLEDVENYFIGFKYKQLDLSLNYLLSLVQDRIATVFTEEIDSFVDNINTVTIILDLIIIIFVFISAIILVFIIIRNLLDLDNLVQRSTTRINRSTCYIKMENLNN